MSVVALVWLLVVTTSHGQANRVGGIRVLPVMTALDADGDGEISAAEIKRSVSALKKLDKNKDDKLTEAELLPALNRGLNPELSLNSIAESLPPLPMVPKEIEGVSIRRILELFGAKGRHGGTKRQLANYRRVFGFTDTDKDGRHSKQEYIENGNYLIPQSRRGIFQASDSNNDGFVSQAEYVENRLITDEAKLIFDELDTNGDGNVTRKEFLASGKLKDEKLAKGVFMVLDTNGDGKLVISEYLRVWGRWARH